MIGGVLVILGVAVGLTNYLVGVQLPAKLVEWVRAHIESRIAFLLVLNVFLLIVGWFMEIFAAIVVVVPLIVPLGAAFGINPVHLGIIFVSNLELGFLTPLVGLLFRRRDAHVRCRSLSRHAAVQVILGLGVLEITTPWLTTGLPGCQRFRSRWRAQPEKTPLGGLSIGPLPLLDGVWQW